jgi:hypothetical protein
MRDWHHEGYLRDLSSGKEWMWQAVNVFGFSEEGARHELDVRGLPQPEVAKARAREALERTGICPVIVDAVRRAVPGCLEIWLGGDSVWGDHDEDNDYTTFVVIPDEMSVGDVEDTMYRLWKNVAFRNVPMRFAAFRKARFDEVTKENGYNARVKHDGVLLHGDSV